MHFSPKRIVFILSVLLFFTYATSSFGALLQNEAGDYYLSNKLILTINNDCPKLNIGEFTVSGFSSGISSIDILCKANGVVKIEPWYRGKIRHAMHLKQLVERMYIFTIDERKDIRDVVNAFVTDNHLEAVSTYDVPVPLYQPNDPSINQQWFLSTIHAFDAWDLVRGDTTKNVIIGISDTGVYYDHPDLQPNMWINGPEDINGNGIFDNFDENEGGDLNYWDDDGNGYDDDVVGYDFGVNDPDPEEETPTHGTHVAGCASEATDNNTGGAGVGFSARLIAAKGANSSGALTAVYQALTYCVDQGAHFVNCSWGSPSYNSQYQNIITQAFWDGCLIIAAAGNDNVQSKFYPAGYDNCLAVAATAQGDAKASFSNYGTWIDIASPGVSIYSTWAHSSYAHLDGTSMASPVCTGVASLIKAQDPSRGPQQIWNIIKSSADSASLYGANPSYIGKLGSGRVDAFAALASGNMPNIGLSSSYYTITDDDGDGVLNPGETISLVITVQNSWSDAFNVSGTLHSTDEVTVTDSTTDYGDIPGGDSADNASDPFIVEIHSDVAPQVLELSLSITADDYSTEIPIELEISLFQKNYPLSVDGNIEGHMGFVNLDGNSGEELVFGTTNDEVHALKSDGTELSGFPVSVDGDIVNGIAVGQVVGDDNLELVAATKSGKIYVIENDGQIASGFPIDAGGSYYGTPSLVDIDNDGFLEIFCPAFTDGKLYAYNGDGSAVSGFPVETGDHFYGSVAIGDVDDDGSDEIVGAALNGNLYVWNDDGSVASGFPIDLGSNVWVSTALGDIDGDGIPEIVAGTQEGLVYAYNGDGSIVSGFPVDVGSTIKADPIIANVRYDEPALEIVIGTNSHLIYLINGSGEIVSGFPVEIGNALNGSPVVADIDGDGRMEIMAAATDGIIYGINDYGSTVANFPIPTYGILSTSSLALGDIDGDGDVELATGLRQNDDNVIVVDYKVQVTLIPEDWTMYGSNMARIHIWTGTVIGVDEDAPNQLPTDFALSQNYPNPFNPETKISYSLPHSTDVTLTVYNLAGQRIAELVNKHQQAGSYEVSWNGKTAEGKSGSSGIYFYRLHTDNYSAIRKMVLMK